MNKIRLNDGTEYPVEFCGLADGVVAFRMTEPATISTLAPVMADAEKTAKITYLLDNTLVPDQPVVAAVHEGYTRNIGILIDRWDGKPLVQMTKEG